jgi:hypothetical protein
MFEEFSREFTQKGEMLRFHSARPLLSSSATRGSAGADGSDIV